LHANEGRETKALNCKPNTNLKEISELSNYSKTSGFRLHAVIASFLHKHFSVGKSKSQSFCLSAGILVLRMSTIFCAVESEAL
jgi:hypothetical protein